MLSVLLSNNKRQESLTGKWENKRNHCCNSMLRIRVCYYYGALETCFIGWRPVGLRTCVGNIRTVLVGFLMLGAVACILPRCAECCSTSDRTLAALSFHIGVQETNQETSEKLGNRSRGFNWHWLSHLSFGLHIWWKHYTNCNLVYLIVWTTSCQSFTTCCQESTDIGSACGLKDPVNPRTEWLTSQVCFGQPSKQGVFSMA